MFTPFINWFWRPAKSKGINFNWKISDHIGAYDKAQTEYDSRINSFELHLNAAGLFEEYMQLKNCANKVMLEWNRIGFTREILDYGRKNEN